MRVLFLSAYLPGRGLHGGSSRIFELLHHLHRQNDITLLCFMNRADDDSKVKDLKAMCQKLHIFPISAKRPFYLFPYEPFVDYYSPDFRKKLTKILQKEKFDIVQFEFAQMGIYRRDIKNTPSIMTEHEVNFLAHRKDIQFLKSPLRKFRMYYNSLQMMKRELDILQQMDRVICMNRHDADALLGYLPEEKLDILPHGVDTSYFSPMPNIQTDPYSIGFFGAYHHYPNVDAVLHFVQDIFPLVKAKIPAAHFHIIGIHPPPEILELNNRTDITVTGFVSDIRPYMARCRVIVAPLRMGLGMRVKMLEAMAMGKPIVASELAAAGLDVDDGRHLIIANSPESFSESVCYLIQDKPCADRMAEEARRRLEESYTYTEIGKRLENIYLSVIERASQGDPPPRSPGL